MATHGHTINVALGEVLEQGIEKPAHRFTERHGSHEPGELGPEIASLLGQADDQVGQTRRMAMTVLINALSFDEALPKGRLQIEREELSPPLPPWAEAAAG